MNTLDLKNLDGDGAIVWSALVKGGRRMTVAQLAECTGRSIKTIRRGINNLEIQRDMWMLRFSSGRGREEEFLAVGIDPLRMTDIEEVARKANESGDLLQKVKAFLYAMPVHFPIEDRDPRAKAPEEYDAQRWLLDDLFDQDVEKLLMLTGSEKTKPVRSPVAYIDGVIAKKKVDAYKRKVFQSKLYAEADREIAKLDKPEPHDKETESTPLKASSGNGKVVAINSKTQAEIDGALNARYGTDGIAWHLLSAESSTL